MRIIFADYKTRSIEEPKQTFPSLIDAISALDRLLSQRTAMFGQVLDNDGRVLANRALVEDTSETSGSGVSA